MPKSPDYIAGLKFALRECERNATANGNTSRASTNDVDRDTFAERARGCAECAQYIRQTIEIEGGTLDPEE